MRTTRSGPDRPRPEATTDDDQRLHAARGSARSPRREGAPGAPLGRDLRPHRRTQERARCRARHPRGPGGARDGQGDAWGALPAATPQAARRGPWRSAACAGGPRQGTSVHEPARLRLRRRGGRRARRLHPAALGWRRPARRPRGRVRAPQPQGPRGRGARGGRALALARDRHPAASRKDAHHRAGRSAHARAHARAREGAAGREAGPRRHRPHRGLAAWRRRRARGRGGRAARALGHHARRGGAHQRSPAASSRSSRTRSSTRRARCRRR